MGRVCYVVFFVVCPLLLLSNAHEAKRSNANCQFLPCGRIGYIHFPFTDRRYPECGLLNVDNCDKPDGIPKIHLGKDVPSFYISEISDDYTMLLHDKEQLARNPWNLQHNICEPLKNISLLSHPFLSFKLLFNIPVFICPPSQIIPKNFSLTCNNSKNSILFYKEAPNHHHVPNSLPNCLLVPFLNRTEKGVELLNLYAGFFLLKVQVTEECKKCYYVRGGQCKSDKRGKFHCSNRKKGNGKLALALGLGGSAVLLVVLFLCIISYRKKRKYSSPSFNSRNASPDPSSKSKLEVGSVYYGVPIFSYSELAKATNDFGHEKELGNGGFGKVYYGKLRDGREVAVKRLYEHNYRRVEQFMNEVKILTRLCHKNLVSLYGCTSRHSQQGLLLVYEYVPNGTVADHLYGGRAKPGSLTWSTRMNIAIETASALAYLHASDIIHRDVKTNNILLDNSFCVKVADFGLSRLFPNDVTHVSTAPQGSPGYVDPEYHQCYQLTDKSDVYSLGVVLIELISSLPAVDTSRQKDEINLANLAINKIQKSAINELVDPNLGYQSDVEVKRMTTAVAELAFLCLQQIKETRPSMDVVLKELKRIESGESKLENLKEKKDDNDVLKSMQPLTSPILDYDNIALLKPMRVSSSPISVSEDWVSSNSTWSTSNVSS